jgi:c-di-GMP-binding flagellar brake protein YcgR
VSNSEKRQYPRVQVNRPGRIRIEDGPERHVQLMDISEVGAMLFFSTALEEGTTFELRFQLKLGVPVACLAYGEVRHSFERGQSHLIGVEFSHFGPDTGEAIREFIRQRLEAGG